MEKKTFVVSPQVGLDDKPSSMQRFTLTFVGEEFEYLLREHFTWRRFRRFEYIVKMLFHMVKNNEATYLIVSQAYVLPFFRRRQIVIVHDLIQMNGTKFSISYVLNYISLCLGVKEVWPVSSTTKSLCEFYGIRSLRDPIGVPNAFEDIKRVSEEEKKYDFLWIGTLAEHKKFDDLIALASRYKELSFVAVVPNYQLSIARKKCQCTLNIELLSSLSDSELRALYVQSKNFISTSTVEGFGMPILEASRLGLGVVLRNIPIYREILLQGKYFDNISDLELRKGKKYTSKIDETRLRRYANNFNEYKRGLISE